LGPSIFAELAPRIEAFRARGGSLVTFHIGDTHRSPPLDARFAMHERADSFDRELYAYGPIGGMPELKAAIAESRSEPRRFGPAIDPKTEVLIGTGATHAIFSGARSILNPGDEVLLFSPYWPLAVGILRACDANVVEVPVSQRAFAEGEGSIGAWLRAHVSEKTRALNFISPNNPDGKVWGHDALAQIAQVAEEFDLWVISDEVYADTVFGEEHISIRSLPGMASRTLVATSFSKSHALAGARVGALIGPREVIAVATRVATHSGFNVPLVAQKTALTAMRTGQSWLAESKSAYREAMDLTTARLRAAGIAFFAPQGGSYVFVDFRPILERKSARLADLLEVAIDHGVLLCPGAASGVGFENHARLCYTAVPKDELATGLARLSEAVSAFVGA